MGHKEGQATGPAHPSPSGAGDKWLSSGEPGAFLDTRREPKVFGPQTDQFTTEAQTMVQMNLTGHIHLVPSTARAAASFLATTLSRPRTLGAGHSQATKADAAKYEGQGCNRAGLQGAWLPPGGSSINIRSRAWSPRPDPQALCPSHCSLRG